MVFQVLYYRGLEAFIHQAMYITSVCSDDFVSIVSALICCSALHLPLSLSLLLIATY